MAAALVQLPQRQTFVGGFQWHEVSASGAVAVSEPRCWDDCKNQHRVSAALVVIAKAWVEGGPDGGCSDGPRQSARASRSCQTHGVVG
jgi:hypothetical protein